LSENSSRETLGIIERPQSINSDLRA